MQSSTEMWRALISLFCTSVLGACSEAAPDSTSTEQEPVMNRELVILASPPENDAYYAEVTDDIFNFHIRYAQQISEKDAYLIFVADGWYQEYIDALGPDHIVPVEMADIWMRDFSLSNAINPVMFRYSTEGQGGGRKGQRDADAVQEILAEVLEEARLRFTESDLFNDGGNFVDDYAGNVVISRKFLRDNELTEPEGRIAIRKITGAANVAFIEADEQGGLEHADGVVAFIDENVLVINSYPEDPAYTETLKADLSTGLPGVTIHEIVTAYDGSEIYDARFGSACGLYTNMLVTPERIYFPQFGIPEDTQALAQIRRWTDKEVIPVQSSQVCQMGGGVRCMSWQLRGENAERLLEYAQSKVRP